MIRRIICSRRDRVRCVPEAAAVDRAGDASGALCCSVHERFQSGAVHAGERDRVTAVDSGDPRDRRSRPERTDAVPDRRADATRTRACRAGHAGRRRAPARRGPHPSIGRRRARRHAVPPPVPACAPRGGHAHDPGRGRGHRPCSVLEPRRRRGDIPRGLTSVGAGFSTRRPRTGTVPTFAIVSATAALGCGALAARPFFLSFTTHPAGALALLFAALLVIGVASPLPAPGTASLGPPSTRAFALATATG